MRMCVTRLKGKASTIEARLWERWLVCAGCFARGFDELEDDPFAYNETASVSALAAAAAMAGMLSVAEYPVDKKHRKDRRKNVRGRADFWLHSDQKTWSIEFKQLMPEKHKPSLNELHKTLAKAVADAHHLSKDEADIRVGALIVSTYWLEEKDKRAETLHTLREFGNDHRVQFSWEVDPGGVQSGTTFFYFATAT